MMIRNDDWITALFHGRETYLYKMMHLKTIAEQIRGASKIEGTSDDIATAIPQENITKELSKVGATDFTVTTIKGNYAITMTRKFEDYKKTLKFVNDVAKISEKLDHHPNVYFDYDTVKIEIYSFSHDTVTTKDIEFAKLVSKK
jgi:4a-hydroxytetrahydrobiopterin dehydratase